MALASEKKNSIVGDINQAARTRRNLTNGNEKHSKCVIQWSRRAKFFVSLVFRARVLFVACCGLFFSFALRARTCPVLFYFPVVTCPKIFRTRVLVLDAVR
jgi:hypothetical protein